MSEDVTIVTSPDVPKTMVDTVFATADEAGHMSLQLLSYLRTGDINHLRAATNSLLRIRSMGTKTLLNELMVCGMRGEHPLSSEDRKKLYLQMLAEATDEKPA